MENYESYGIFDIHSHILERVDDGSRNIEESINLLIEAERAGVTDIILTPHYYKGMFEKDKFTIREKYNTLREIARNERIDINLYCGNEIYTLPDISNEMDKYHTLGNSKYVLLETSFEVKQLYLEHEFQKFLDKGYTPIFAHVERYQFIQKNIDLLEKYIDMGVEIQSNYGSIIGLYGRGAEKTVKKLLKREMIDYMASDVHRAQTIYTYMPDILDKIEKITSPEYFERITYLNAQNIIRNRENQ